VSNERASVTEEKNIQGVPDLLVEVLSPTSHRRDTSTSFDLYMSRGVLEYWIVDPAERTIAVWVRRGELFVLKGEHAHGGRARSEVLAGFSVAVKSVCP
jgi:Uma2 family endonuclease